MKTTTTVKINDAVSMQLVEYPQHPDFKDVVIMQQLKNGEITPNTAQHISREKKDELMAKAAAQGLEVVTVTE